MIVKAIAFTTNEYYRRQSERLEASLTKYGIPYQIERLEHPGSWHKAVSMKPAFIKRMLEQTTLDGVLYLDADAEVVAPLPMDSWGIYDIGFTRFKRSPEHDEEFLTGTMFFRKHPMVLDVLDKWAELTASFPHSHTPEQDALKHVLAGSTGLCSIDLGPAWTYIHDDFKELYPDVKPLILHYQASREYREREQREERAKVKAQAEQPQ